MTTEATPGASVEGELRNIIVHQAAQLLESARQAAQWQGLLQQAQAQLDVAAREIESMRNELAELKDAPLHEDDVPTRRPRA